MSSFSRGCLSFHARQRVTIPTAVDRLPWCVVITHVIPYSHMAFLTPFFSSSIGALIPSTSSTSPTGQIIQAHPSCTSSSRTLPRIRYRMHHRDMSYIQSINLNRRINS
ncbi:uncharacterized protein BKA55DRAFT_376028 [Fusarium redolens]|uniref:Uncharacterized protein n=1 Tax=Fusarium redolens TaxID=48865 RepID=A0A9P9H4Z9_FUSRE|nr:uncharacterized protein BKA55DRAFT_376028 [Fusarium redolens]KAH7250239.1 hypothetical protein BKA55DRAFT_376028 [Fusarium redolens]